MTSPIASADSTSEKTCCGEGGSWAPKPGGELVAGCALCPRSPTYWRRVRADGRPYEPVKALNEMDTI